MDITILHTLRTKDTAGDLLDFIEYLSEKTHSTDVFNLDKFINDFLVDSHKPHWLEYFINLFSQDLSKLSGSIIGNNTFKENEFNGVKIKNVPNMDIVRSILEEAKVLIKNAEILKIEIPFTPSNEFIVDVYETIFRSKLLGDTVKNKKGFLIEILVKDRSTAETKIFLEGRVINMSIRDLVYKYLIKEDVIGRYI